MLSQILSLIGCLFLLLSTFLKSKKRMLMYQVGDTLFNALANVSVGSYTGMLTNLVSCVRNIFNIKNKNNDVINFLLILILILLGLIVNSNDRNLITCLPIVASVEYTILSYKFTSSQCMRIALIINLVLWAIHDICVGLYVAFMIDIVILIVTVINFIRNKSVAE